METGPPEKASSETVGPGATVTPPAEPSLPVPVDSVRPPDEPKVVLPVVTRTGPDTPPGPAPGVRSSTAPVSPLVA